MDTLNNKIIIEQDGEYVNYYDFNKYPISLTETNYQVFLLPTENDEDCYIVRKTDSVYGVSHSMFANKLVKSEFFDDDYKITDLDDEYEILNYLINKKGYILYSPAQKNENITITFNKGFMPLDKNLMTHKQVNNFLYLIERDHKMIVEEDLLKELYDFVTVDKKR